MASDMATGTPAKKLVPKGHTGKDCDVVLVGLVQCVVDDAFLIWEALEDVHTDLVGGEGQADPITPHGSGHGPLSPSMACAPHSDHKSDLNPADGHLHC